MFNVHPFLPQSNPPTYLKGYPSSIVAPSTRAFKAQDRPVVDENTSPDHADEDDQDLDNDLPALDGGVRNLSVSSDGTIDSLLDEAPTPPMSPALDGSRFTNTPSFSIRRPSADAFGEHDDDEESKSFEKCKAPCWTAADYATPPSTTIDLAAPTTPRNLNSGTFLAPSTTSPGLATRRAQKGTLTTRALLALQQMRFEAPPEAGPGLGVGPGSAGFEGFGLTPSPRFDEGSSAGSGSTSMVFRLALGLGDECTTSTPTQDAFGLTPVDVPVSPSSISPTEIQAPSQWPAASPSRSRFLGHLGSFPPLQSPALRPLKLLPPSSLGPASPRERRDHGLSAPSTPHLGRPASPSLSRTSAFSSHFSQGPLTPLTPSHMPGAPLLSGGTQFDWSAYSIPDSPVTIQSPASPLVYSPIVSGKTSGFSTPSVSPSDRFFARNSSSMTLQSSPLCG